MLFHACSCDQQNNRTYCPITTGTYPTSSASTPPFLTSAESVLAYLSQHLPDVLAKEANCANVLLEEWALSGEDDLPKSRAQKTFARTAGGSAGGDRFPIWTEHLQMSTLDSMSESNLRIHCTYHIDDSPTSFCIDATAIPHLHCTIH